MRLTLKPIPLRVANEYVTAHDPDHPAVRGCKFCIGCYCGALLIGVVIVERPKARHLDDGWTLELSRVCTSSQPKAASKLITAATLAAFAMGARYVLAYSLTTEDGAAYRAAGWQRMEVDGAPIEFGGGEWSRPSRRRDPMESPTDRKHRWERYNAAAVEDMEEFASAA